MGEGKEVPLYLSEISWQLSNYSFFATNNALLFTTTECLIQMYIMSVCVNKQDNMVREG
jgi:hypothetical protein